MTKRKRFTLVELLVAIGLLSLIMMLLLQLFTGAQKIWVASEKTNNVYSDARVAMELMADILNTTQFSYGKESRWNMIFSLDSSNRDGGYDSNSVTFVSKTARDLPMKDNTTRFIRFRLGASDDNATRGKLFMDVYSDIQNDFYDFFPDYDSKGGTRDNARSSLLSRMNSVAGSNSTVSGENEECQVIAESVISFKINAYHLNGGTLEKEDDASDVTVPPYMIELQLTILDADSYKRWQELSGEAKTKYLDQNKRTFTRNVYIGNRWVLEAKAQNSSGN